MNKINSLGNNYSDGNNRSHGNNYSDGNNWSHGNNHSYGNNCSHGNNYSHGNNCSFFLNNCHGTHYSALCIDKDGIAYMVLNQQMTEVTARTFINKLREISGEWLPYQTNYFEMKEKGWHKEYKDTNEYVEPDDDDSKLNIVRYQKAWSTCQKKKEIIALIKETKELDTAKALKTFEEITGIKDEEEIEEITMEELCKILGKIVKIKK